uniref:Uncharacterized protein LOC113799206 n=1 Tax=Dermatophagoides pteronyssinus TaxID=6956 RepID=A0A6P6YK21_DERPT|nr:uncharacterized protein LOC113799206 [Dermatophagoides pteronyssinus]
MFDKVEQQQQQNLSIINLLIEKNHIFLCEKSYTNSLSSTLNNKQLSIFGHLWSAALSSSSIIRTFLSSLLMIGTDDGSNNNDFGMKKLRYYLLMSTKTNQK